MFQPAALLAEHDASNDSSTAGPKTAAQRNRVLDMHMGLTGKGALVVAAQHVQGDTGEQVDLRVKRDLVGALALTLVGDAAVERVCRRLFGTVDGNVQLQIHRQGEADDVEAWANVGGGARGLDDEGLDGHCDGVTDPAVPFFFV